MKVSVIISTYNQPEWLEKVLWGYECQVYSDFEIVIADDGSGAPTKNLVNRFIQDSKLRIQHVWQEDEGFQKSKILNKATLAATGDYLIFTDGDCIPRKDFVAVHVKKATEGRFLSGGYFMLPMTTSKAISKEDVVNGNVFDIKWLYDHDVPSTYKSMKLTSSGWKEKLLNWITPTKPTWNGHGASGWKKDIIAVNGYNEKMQYGGQDRELGERLENAGIKGMQIRYSAVVVHLDHKRSYKTPETLKKNRAIRKETRDLKRVWTEFGIIHSKTPVAN
jgi:glycosyltransferase involved in cell wall biosynthesis